MIYGYFELLSYKEMVKLEHQCGNDVIRYQDGDTTDNYPAGTCLAHFQGSALNIKSFECGHGSDHEAENECFDQRYSHGVADKAVGNAVDVVGRRHSAGKGTAREPSHQREKDRHDNQHGNHCYA